MFGTFKDRGSKLFVTQSLFIFTTPTQQQIVDVRTRPWPFLLECTLWPILS